MRITKAYIRFYKSFNYDYERKFGRTSEPDPWELIDEAWYPFVRIDLEPSVTTIVGANESGKSHLLDAIQKVITGEGIDRGDFCRYSRYFSVEQGHRRSPDFGLEVEVINADDVAGASKTLGLDLEPGDRFNLFRLDGQAPVIFSAGAVESVKVTAKDADLAALLPKVFRLDAHTPLPDSIPLHEDDWRRPLARNATSAAQPARGSARSGLAVRGRVWEGRPEVVGLRV